MCLPEHPEEPREERPLTWDIDDDSIVPCATTFESEEEYTFRMDMFVTDDVNPLDVPLPSLLTLGVYLDYLVLFANNLGLPQTYSLIQVGENYWWPDDVDGGRQLKSYRDIR